MSAKKWTEILSGDLNAGIQRLLVGLGDKAGALIRRLKNDKDFVHELVQFIKNKISNDWWIEDKIIRLSYTCRGETDCVSQWKNLQKNKKGNVHEGLFDQNITKQINGVPHSISDTKIEIGIVIGGLMESENELSDIKEKLEKKGYCIRQLTSEEICFLCESLTNKDFINMGIHSELYCHQIPFVCNGNKLVLAIRNACVPNSGNSQLSYIHYTRYLSDEPVSKNDMTRAGSARGFAFAITKFPKLKK